MVLKNANEKIKALTSLQHLPGSSFLVLNGELRNRVQIYAFLNAVLNDAQEGQDVTDAQIDEVLYGDTSSLLRNQVSRRVKC